LKALTGLFTPPGMTVVAFLNSLFDFSSIVTCSVFPVNLFNLSQEKFYCQKTTHKKQPVVV
jgi:hypothetical protein